MLQLKEWQTKKEVRLACGHTLKAGETAYTITLFVCQQEVTCLPQAIKTCFAAKQPQPAPQVTSDSFLYWLWQRCFGKQRQRPA
jgi:hypothetical protein